MHPSVRLRAGCVLGALLALAACGGAASQPVSGAGGQPVAGATSTPAGSPSSAGSVTFLLNPTLANAPLYVAIDGGFLKKLGVDARLTTMNDPAIAVPSLVGGKAQFIGQPPSSALANAITGGSPLLVLAATSVNNSAYPASCFMVSKSLWANGVRSFADLKGQTVAVPLGRDSGFARNVTVAADHFGLKVGVDVKEQFWTNLGQAVQAFLGGEVNAISIAQPFCTQLEVQGGAHDIYDPTALEQGQPALLLVTSRTWAQAHRQLVVRTLEGVLEAGAYYDQAQASGWKQNTDVVSILAKNANVRPQIFQSMKAASWMPPDGTFTPALLQTAMQYFKQSGGAQSLPRVSSYVDFSYVKAAAQALREAK